MVEACAVTFTTGYTRGTSVVLLYLKEYWCFLIFIKSCQYDGQSLLIIL